MSELDRMQLADEIISGLSYPAPVINLDHYRPRAHAPVVATGKAPLTEGRSMDEDNPDLTWPMIGALVLLLIIVLGSATVYALVMP